MIRAREYAERTRLQLEGWHRAGHAAYLSLFEVIGEPRVGLRTVQSIIENGIRAGYRGKAWDRLKDALGVRGRIASFTFALTEEGGWIVRGWVVHATERQLSSEAHERLTGHLGRMWSRHMEEMQDSAISQRTEFVHPVHSDEIEAVSHIITDCISPLDPPGEWAAAIYDRYGMHPATEESIADAWERYRDEREALDEIFRPELVIDERFELGYTSTRGFYVSCTCTIGGETVSSERHVELPERAWRYAEFAVERMESRAWSSTGSDAAWQQLSRDAQRTVNERGLAYLPVPEGPLELNRPVSWRRVTKK